MYYTWMSGWVEINYIWNLTCVQSSLRDTYVSSFSFEFIMFSQFGCCKYTQMNYKMGRNSSVASVLGSLSCLIEHCGFDPPLRRNFLVERIFPLELTWVLTLFPQNSFGWKYKPRFSPCTHAFHRTDSEDPDIHVLDQWMPATKTYPACTIPKDGTWLPKWLDYKTVTYAKISLKMVNPRDIAGEHRRRRRITN